MRAMSIGGATARSWGARALHGIVARRDLLLVLLMMVVIVLIAAPVPVVALDVLIVVNFALSFVVLLTVIAAPSPLALSSFPSLLLFATLLRLGLNIASTKIILLTAHGPHVVEAFGKIVVGGNFVVGCIVFLIIAVVQFVVIAKGSERAAEVAARFTLDAMPGNQLAIEADLRAGLITPNDVRQRRLELDQATKMHGAMDGAMKFVKGDAIAGLVIAVIIILGGIAVGVGMRDMSLGEAAARFTLLSIGDAMVAQIPSLILSMAAGLLITQAVGDSTQQNSGALILDQLSSNPRVLMMSAGLMVAGALVPGFPAMPFLVVSILLLVPVLMIRRRDRAVLKTHLAPIQAFAADGKNVAPPMVSIVASRIAQPLCIVVAPSLARRVSPTALNAAFMLMRNRLVQSLAIPFPGISMIESAALEPGGFEVHIYEVAHFEARLPSDRIVIDVGDGVGALPSASDHISSSLAALNPRWRLIELPAKDPIALPDGVSVVGREAVLAQSVERVLTRHGASLIGIGEATKILRIAEIEHPEMVAELAKLLTITKVAEVLRCLAEDGLSLRDMRNILDTLVNAAVREKDVSMLTELVRIGLSGQTCQRLSRGTGIVRVAILSATAESDLMSALGASRGSYLPYTTEDAKRVIDQFNDIVGPSSADQPAIAVHAELRRYLKKLIEPHAPDLWVVSFGELSKAKEVVILGELEMKEPSGDA